MQLLKIVEKNGIVIMSGICFKRDEIQNYLNLEGSS